MEPRYHQVGVMLTDLRASATCAAPLFDVEQRARARTLMHTVDRINARMGRLSARLSGCGQGQVGGTLRFAREDRTDAV